MWSDDFNGDMALEPLEIAETVDYEKVLYEALVNEDAHSRVSVQL